MAEGISRIGIISLVSAADTAAPLAPPGLGLRREPSGVLAGGGSNAGQEGKGRTGLTAVDLQLAAPPFAEPLARWAEGNQKLLLLAAFLQVGGAAVLLFEGPPESGAPAMLLQAPTARTAFSPRPLLLPAADRQLGARAAAHALAARPGRLRLCALPARGPRAL